MVKNKIVKDVKNAGIFSVQMDSTQDISAYDQRAIVLRYVVRDRPKERLVFLVNVDNSSRKCCIPCYKIHLKRLEKCIGDLYDGATNMNGVLVFRHL